MDFRIATDEDRALLTECIESEWPDQGAGLVPNAKTLIFEHGFVSFGVTHGLFPTVQHFYIDPAFRYTGEARKMLFAFLEIMRVFSFAKIIMIIPRTPSMDRLAGKIMEEFDVMPYGMDEKNWYILIPTEDK